LNPSSLLYSSGVDASRHHELRVDPGERGAPGPDASESWVNRKDEGFGSAGDAAEGGPLIQQGGHTRADAQVGQVVGAEQRRPIHRRAERAADLARVRDDIPPGVSIPRLSPLLGPPPHRHDRAPPPHNCSDFDLPPPHDKDRAPPPHNHNDHALPPPHYEDRAAAPPHYNELDPPPIHYEDRAAAPPHYGADPALYEEAGRAWRRGHTHTGGGHTRGGYTAGGHTSGGHTRGGHNGGGYTEGDNTEGGKSSGGYTGGGFTEGGHTSGGRTGGGHTGRGHTSGGNTNGSHTGVGNTEGGHTDPQLDGPEEGAFALAEKSVFALETAARRAGGGDGGGGSGGDGGGRGGGRGFFAGDRGGKAGDGGEGGGVGSGRGGGGTGGGTADLGVPIFAASLFDGPSNPPPAAPASRASANGDGVGGEGGGEGGGGDGGGGDERGGRDGGGGEGGASCATFAPTLDAAQSEGYAESEWAELGGAETDTERVAGAEATPVRWRFRTKADRERQLDRLKW